MDELSTSFPAPDVIGLPEPEAREILCRQGFRVRSENITQTVKRGQPEGRLRVVRQRVCGQEIDLVYAFEKWLAEERRCKSEFQNHR